MILCVLKQILHRKKVIFIQLQVSPILPYCLLLLCHKIVKKRYYSRGIRDMKKCIFEAPLNEIRCVLGIKESKFNGKNRSKFEQSAHFLL